MELRWLRIKFPWKNDLWSIDKVHARNSLKHFPGRVGFPAGNISLKQEPERAFFYSVFVINIAPVTGSSFGQVTLNAGPDSFLLVRVILHWRYIDDRSVPHWIGAGDAAYLEIKVRIIS